MAPAAGAAGAENEKVKLRLRLRRSLSYFAIGGVDSLMA